MGEAIFRGKAYKDIDNDAQHILHQLNIHTFRYFPKDKVWMASDMFMKHFGTEKFYELNESSRALEIVYEDDAPKDSALYRKIMAGASFATDKVRSKNGESYYKVSLTVVDKDENGEVSVIAGIVEDYDEQMRQTELANLLSEDYSSIFVADFAKGIVSAYRTLDAIRVRYGDLIDSKPSYVSLMDKYVENEVIDELKTSVRDAVSYDNLRKQFKKEKVFRYEYVVIRDGYPQNIRVKFVNLSDGDKLTRMVFGFANIDVERQEKLESLAYTDQVTKGNNYNYYTEKLRNESHSGFVVSMDIRAFKVVNSVCGIEAGDMVLRDVSSIIERAVNDIGFYGHVNADHFVFFLHLNDRDKVVDVIDKISDGVNKLVLEGQLPKISAYFGITTWRPGDRIHVAFSEANTAKHKIKNSTEKSYAFYLAQDNETAILEKKIEDAFEDALENKEFEIWYQPKYDPIRYELTGAEALVRWRNKDGELISPGRFIPVFEKNGMIRRLDEYVFTEVCRQQKLWQDNNIKIVPVSINLSRASLYYDNIVERYSSIAKTIGIDTGLVPIEITESAAVDNKDIKQLADEFYKAGFPLHIDDFGSGYSSLSTLNMMRFDTLKLDKSLVDYIGEFGGDRLIKHTVALAKDLGLHVTAEGVEKQEQVDFLKNVECDNIQGYFFSKPLMLFDYQERLQGA